MNLKFIHFEESEADTFVCFNKIAYVQRMEDAVFVYFDGNSKPVRLHKEQAKIFLRVVQDNSLTIYHAAPEQGGQ